jgi:hypothetical protein
MRKAPEVVREVGVDDVRVTPEQQLLHLYDGLPTISPPQYLRPYITLLATATAAAAHRHKP